MHLRFDEVNVVNQADVFNYISCTQKFNSIFSQGNNGSIKKIVSYRKLFNYPNITVGDLSINTNCPKKLEVTFLCFLS